MAFSSLACTEILDGTQRLPASLCRFETMLVATALTTAFVSYGSVKGVEAGISLLVVLMSLKILEAHTAREFRVMVTDRVDALFVWIFPFPRLHDRALSPDRVCLARCRTDPVSSRSVTGRRLASGWHDVQTPPSGLAACCPVLSPVSPNQYWTSGLNCVPSVRQTPAFPIDFLLEASQLLQILPDIAFRAEFPGSNTRPSGPMYWRGVVMWRCDGMEWRAPYAPRPKSHLPRQTSRAAAVSLFNRPTPKKSGSGSR